MNQELQGFPIFSNSHYEQWQKENKNQQHEFSYQQFSQFTNNPQINISEGKMKIQIQARQNNHKILSILLNSLSQYKETIVSIIDQIINSIGSQIEIMEREIQYLQNGQQLLSYNSPEEIVQEKWKRAEDFKKFKNTTLQKLQLLKNIETIEENVEKLQKIEFLEIQEEFCSKIVQIPEKSIQNADYIPKYEYVLLNQQFIKLKESCHTMSLNHDSSLLIVGQGKKIKIFQLRSEHLIEIQEIKAHDEKIEILRFFSKNRGFFSYGLKKDIKFWQQNLKGEWINIQTIKKVTPDNIILNKSEDLIVCGGYEKINFYHFDGKQWEHNQVIKCKNSIFGLTLNDSSTKLIAAILHENIILVVERMQSEWQITLEFEVHSFGTRLCFINETDFAFQPASENLLYIYHQDDSEFKYWKQTIEVNYPYKNFDTNQFHMQVVQQRNFLIGKHQKQINIFSIQKIFDVKLINDIYFETENFVGCISNDGLLIFVWDDKSKQIRIWKLYEII